jgi:hypothetical protein
MSHRATASRSTRSRDPELQSTRRCYLGHQAEFVFDTQGEPGHVEVAMAAIGVDQQVQVAV